MANPQTSGTDFDALRRIVFEVTGGQRALSIDLASRDESRKNFDIKLDSGKIISFSLLNPTWPPAIIQSEVSTVRYLRDYTSIPVANIVAFDVGPSGSLGAFVAYEKPVGLSLDAVLPDLSMNEQDAIVAQIARWTAKLLNHRFDSIGSLYPDTRDGYIVGPIVDRTFFVEGRAKLKLDRGPFASTREYLLACTQREIDCAQSLVAQNIASESSRYQKDVEECRLQVEGSMLLLSDLIMRCKGLDMDDPDLAAFSLDIHELSMKNFIVSEQDHSQLVAVTGFDCISTKPLWQCGRLPRWLVPSMSEEEDDTKVRLSAIFRHVISTDRDIGGIFLRALGSEGSTRCSLHDLCGYDAFKDGFLLRPTLESISATLPGEEDVEGLTRILDPSTVIGRVARISLMTTGSAGNALSLAFSNLDLNGRNSSYED